MALAVRTLFFAAYRDLVHASELALNVADGATVGDLVADLRSRGAPFADLPPEPAVAVNRVYAALSQRLDEGDEVAFIPPVAGG